MKNRVQSQSGASIIEVLVAAVLFVIGFSLIVRFLSMTVDRISFDDLHAAEAIANEQMIAVELGQVSTSADTVVFRQNRRFLVSRTITIEKQTLGVMVSVKRPNSDKQLIRMYDAFAQIAK